MDNPKILPSGAAEHVCLSLSTLSEPQRLSPAAYQHILTFCGIRPTLADWRYFLVATLTLLGLLALVVGTVFFIAWNWNALSPLVKFAVVEGLILALAIVVWWRWYDRVARWALLAVGLSFGGLFALYGQVYQTGADSWELFRAWALVLLPLALIGRQNALWLCFWLIAHLAFQLYYVNQAWFAFDDGFGNHFPWHADTILYGYFAIQAVVLIVRETLAERANKTAPESWLAKRWPSRVIAAYLLLMLTLWVCEAVLEWRGVDTNNMMILTWLAVLLVGYFYYRYRRQDLCMLTLGIASLMVVGCVYIIQWLGGFDVGSLFAMGGLMAMLLVGGGALLLHWRRQLYPRQAVEVSQSEVASLLKKLRQHQLINDEQIAELEQRDHSDHLPWYLSAALVAGGWVAALIILLLLTLLLYVAGLLDDLTGGALIFYSLILAAIALMLLRAASLGRRSIGLAWAIAATCGFYVGIYALMDFRSGDDFVYSLLFFLPVLALMAVVMPDRLYRFMAFSTFIVLLVLPLAYLASKHLTRGIAIGSIVLLVAGLLGLWLWTLSQQNRLSERFTLANALRYSIPTGLAGLCLVSVGAYFLDDIFWQGPHSADVSLMLGGGIAAGLIIAAVIQTCRVHSLNNWVYLPAAIFCGAVALFSPGIGFGLALLLMARHQGSRLLLALAGGFLLVYLNAWYYFLGVSLLYKSLLLFASGVVLLGLAIVVQKLLPVGYGGNHAN